MQLPTSIEAAKEYALNATTCRFTEEEARGRLADYHIYISNSQSESDAAHWLGRIRELEEWLESRQFRSGEFPAGIDAMIFEIIDWRASVHAFSQVELKRNPFRSSLFFAQWLSGAVYVILCHLGKLTSKDPRDNSLRQVWSRVHSFMVQDGACSQAEADALTNMLHHTEGHFTNINSKAICLRNKSIAHNEASPAVEWTDLDTDIQILVRMWALIVGFCSLGIIAPFIGSDAAFAGLGGALSSDELQQLQQKRNEYLDRITLWTRTSTVSGQIADRSPAFAEISIKLDLMDQAEHRRDANMRIKPTGA